MNNLLIEIKKLENTFVKKIVSNKMQEFQSLKKSSNIILFQELCFCLMAANFNAEKSLRIQNALKEELYTLSQEELANKLKELGHRFPNTRAKYIVEARTHNLRKILDSYNNDLDLRNYFAKNIKGLGLKESSHFLRNIGYENLAIIDFHIIDLLVKSNIIIKPKTITPKIYLEAEDILKKIGKKAKLTLAELDLYLWYIETGKIIK
jgi:N-glycosylase/DNA lyase